MTKVLLSRITFSKNLTSVICAQNLYLLHSVISVRHVIRQLHNILFSLPKVQPISVISRSLKEAVFLTVYSRSLRWSALRRCANDVYGFIVAIVFLRVWQVLF